MAQTTDLTAGQRMLLDQLAHEGRIERTPSGYHLVSPWIAYTQLTDETVQALVKAGCVMESESHGVERSVYVLSALGSDLLRGKRAG